MMGAYHSADGSSAPEPGGLFTAESLNEDQKKAYERLIRSSDNFYVTGKAGTGKSYLLQAFVRNSDRRIAVVAPTGIAAINVGGQTIHSFFGMGTSIQAAYDPDEVRKGLNGERKTILNNIDILVIDEVSMVRVDVMDMIDAKLRAAREKDEPFGGCRVIAFGDLYQLPPVAEDDEAAGRFFSGMYRTVLFFGVPAALEKPFRIIELSQVMRQKDPEFTGLLNRIREGDNSEEIVRRLNSRHTGRPEGNGCVTLVTTNSAANRINDQRLSGLEGEEHFYQGTAEGRFDRDDLPTNMLLALKVGAQVILLRNNPGKWANGTIGEITSLAPDVIGVRTPGGTFSVGRVTWVKHEYRYNEEKKQIERAAAGSFTQFPLRLAYALTIHKSQGRTYDCVEVDYSEKRAFAPGQTYVALSRCRDFSSLYLTVPLVPEDITVNQEVADFMHGRFRPGPRGSLKIPVVEKAQARSEFTWRPDRRIEARDFRPHKKITGTRLPNILDMVDRASPFRMWCAMMHVYEEPYKDTVWTRAGEAIEPKQFEYVRKVLAKEGRIFVSPRDRYGDDFKNSTNYDFFRLTERFGGMWDYLLERDGRTVMVFEMKTTGAGNKRYWQKNLPKKYVIQAALYAWLLGIDYFCMVCSFLEEEDYLAPEKFECNGENTMVRPMQISKVFRDFDREVILPAVRWWDEHIETGISPEYDEERDRDILAELRKETGA